MKKKNFINRELSWLEFNQRVLEEARDESLPLLERLKFLAITATNLDEFFMVRVGGLLTLLNAGIKAADASGLTSRQQLITINTRVRKMVHDQYTCFCEGIEPFLAKQGIERITVNQPSREPRPTDANDNRDDLRSQHVSFLEQLFTRVLFPVCTPTAIHSAEEFPFCTGLKLYALVRFERRESAKPAFALIPFPSVLARIIRVPASKKYHYILLEEVIRIFIDRFFPGEPVEECAFFRITRNADLSVEDDLRSDFLSEMEEVLEERKQSDCIRLEVESTMSSRSLMFLQETLSVSSSAIFAIPGPLNLGTLQGLTTLEGFEHLCVGKWPPVVPQVFTEGENIFEILKRQNILLYHPYESFDPVLALIVQAASDPDVLAIKQILYRTSKNSPVIAALHQAALHGKQVTVIIELKARFDEARNIEWAKHLEYAGVQVIYGIRGYKTHAKCSVIVRKEGNGIVRYVHFGTGNYNEVTATLYSDVSYLTSDQILGADASAFFNMICGYSQPMPFFKIEAAPLTIKSKLIELIRSEAQRKAQSHKGLIIAKMNSLVDTDLINELYQASAAGVRILLNIRGICCLRPRVKGLSENITVISIIDRFLEHARIFYFFQGGEEKVFISSADWMPRNLMRRIELMIPVDDQQCRTRLVAIVKSYFDDTAKTWALHAEGSYHRVKPKSGRKTYRVQQELYKTVLEHHHTSRKIKPVTFQPLRPPDV